MSNMKEYTDNWYTEIEKCMTNLELKPRFGGYDTVSVNAAIRKLIGVYNDNIATIIAEYASIEKEKQELQEKVKQVGKNPADNSKLVAENKTLANTVQQLRTQVESAQKNAADALKQMKEQVLRANNAAVALENAQKQNSELQDRVNELSSNMSARTVQAKDNSVVVAKLKQERDEARSEAESIRNLFEDASNEIVNLQNQLLELQSSSSRQNLASMSSVVQEIKRLRQERDVAMAAVKEANDKLHLAEVEKAMLQDQIQEQENVASASSMNADARVSALEEERNEAVRERDNMARVCSSLREELQNMKLEAEDLNEIYREAKRKRRQIIQDAEESAAKLIAETQQRLEQESKDNEENIARTAEESQRAAEELAQKAQSEYDDLVTRAKEEADVMLSEAETNRTQSEETAERLLREAKAKAEALHNEAVSRLKAAKDDAEKVAAEVRNRAAYEADTLVARANEEAKKIEAEAQALLEQARADAEAMAAEVSAERVTRMSGIEEEIRASKEAANHELAEIEERIQAKRNQHTTLLRQIGDVRLSMLDSLQADISRLNQLTHEISRNNVLTSADVDMFAETGFIRPRTITSELVSGDEKKEDIE